jgi:multiple sugar transport system substrate-binding protein
MVATASAYERASGDAISIEWVPRSLKEFGMTSVESLAREVDLIVVDHPHIGMMAESGCVVPFDELADGDVLSELAEKSPGKSHQSYKYGGHQWALAIDAACQASAWRPDRLAIPPASWDDVLALSRGGGVLWPLCDVDASASLLTLAASAGHPCATGESSFIDREVGRWALGMMRAVAERSDRRCLEMNPIGVLEAMSRYDDFVYSPLTFCYVSYSRPGAAGKEVSFGDIPAATAGASHGALLGGAGLAVSALRPETRRAVDYALYVAAGETQRGLYFAAGGQPAHHAAWADPAVDSAAGGFFGRLAGTMRRAWTRPRGPWFAGFQNQMVDLFAGWWERADETDSFLDDLDRLYLDSMEGGTGAA